MSFGKQYIFRAIRAFQKIAAIGEHQAAPAMAMLGVRD